MNKPILCLDFDGVIHSYTSPWVDAETIPDPPVPLALEWISDALEHFKIVIYSSRSKSMAGCLAMQRYLEEHAVKAFGPDHILAGRKIGDYPLDFTTTKPPAFLTIDDRTIQFQGDWSAPALKPAALLTFKPWNRRC